MSRRATEKANLPKNESLTSFDLVNNLFAQTSRGTEARRADKGVKST